MHQEEACEDQNLHVDHLDLCHLNLRTLQETIFTAKMQVMIEKNYGEYALYAVYAKYGNGCDMQDMQDMTDMQNMTDMSSMT